nr:SMP-30/gluconolactonase/LRE family protein [Niveispirillum cyanobacteriorum]
MIDCIWPVGDHTGEGPVWDAQARRLWFVDIKGGRLHSLTPETGARESFEIGGNPSFALPSDQGGLVIGNRDRLLHWRRDAVTELARIPAWSLPTVPMTPRSMPRAACGSGPWTIWNPRPRARCASMTGEPSRRRAQPHRHQRSCHQRRWQDPLPCRQPGPHHLALRYQGWGNHPVRRRAVSHLQRDEGLPDGVVVDAQDHLWVGFWAGGCARRFAPDGTLVTEVRLPCANVTKLALGGPDLRTAYVTTARAGLSAAELAAQPWPVACSASAWRCRDGCCRR